MVLVARWFCSAICQTSLRIRSISRSWGSFFSKNLMASCSSETRRSMSATPAVARSRSASAFSFSSILRSWAWTFCWALVRTRKYEQPSRPSITTTKMISRIPNFMALLLRPRPPCPCGEDPLPRHGPASALVAADRGGGAALGARRLLAHLDRRSLRVRVGRVHDLGVGVERQLDLELAQDLFVAL